MAANKVTAVHITLVAICSKSTQSRFFEAALPFDTDLCRTGTNALFTA